MKASTGIKILESNVLFENMDTRLGTKLLEMSRLNNICLKYSTTIVSKYRKKAEVQNSYHHLKCMLFTILYNDKIEKCQTMSRLKLWMGPRRSQRRKWAFSFLCNFFVSKGKPFQLLRKLMNGIVWKSVLCKFLNLLILIFKEYCEFFSSFILFSIPRR